MKKRIGSKLFDTESSEFVADVGVGNLYRKQTRERGWFLVAGNDIEPLEEPQARALLGEHRYIEKPVDEKRIMIAVDRKTHAVIHDLAKKDCISMPDAVRNIVNDYVRRQEVFEKHKNSKS